MANRYAREKRKPYVPPVKSIEVKEVKHKRLRIVLLVLLVLLAGSAFTYAIQQLLSHQTGWQEVEVLSGVGTTCADEFSLYYNVGGDGAVTDYKTVQTVYSNAAREAYTLFHTNESFDDVVNVKTINENPNQVLTVSPALYQAFEELQEYESRYIFMGPVLSYYQSLYLCSNDSEIYNFDPLLSEDVALDVDNLLTYINDPEAISIELLTDNQICLKVSQEYLDFAQEDGVTDFIDFGWTTNAFITDYIADQLIDAGCTYGTLTSYDGFSRNLDDVSGESYSANIYNQKDGSNYVAAIAQFAVKQTAIVSYRSFEINEDDATRFYELEDGQVRTPYVSMKDGLTKAATENLTCYSYTQNCAQVLLSTMDLYMADSLDTGTLLNLESSQIYSIYFEGQTLCYNDDATSFSNLLTGDSVNITLEKK